MVIRQASPADAASIQTLLAQLGYPGEEFIVYKAIQTYSNEGYHLIVGEADAEIVAFVSLHWFDIFHSPGKMGRITAFCVSENYRSQGIGRELLQASEEFFITKGCTKVEVTCNLRRTLTHEFYLKNGYVIDSKRFIKSIL